MKMRLNSSVINNMFYTSLIRVLIAVEKFIKTINMMSVQIIDMLCVQM